MRLLRLATVALVLAVPAACSSGGNSSPPRTASPTALTVFAASSLTEPFNDLKGSVGSLTPPLAVTYSFAGSPALVTQIEQGAPADVVATADNATMRKLADAGLVEAPVTFAHNKLEIVVRTGNPKGITGIADLARDDIIFVTEDDTVPAGRYAAQMLQAANIIVNPKSKEPNVKAAIGRVTSGEADATIAYVTDARSAGDTVQGVTVPDAQNVVATYPIAIVKATKNHEAAQAFVDAVLRGAGQATLLARGFLPPS